MPTDIDLRTRIQHMRDEDPHGREAAALLPYLAVFREAFDGGALVAVIQSELEASPSLLLKVLRTWGLVERRDKNHHRLASGVAEEVTPLPQYFERHFEYYRTRHTRVDSDRYERISEAWPNIAAALMWGFEHQPDHAVEWVLVLHLYMTAHVPLPEWKGFMQQALQRVGDQSVFNQAQVTKAMGDVAFFEDDLITARQHYDEALRLYDMLPRDHFFWIKDGFFDVYLEQMHPSGEALIAHRRSSVSQTQRDISHLFALYDTMITAMKQDDTQGIRDLATRILAFCKWEEVDDWGPFDEWGFFMMCGYWSQSKQQLESARYFYSHVFDASWDPLLELNALWKWGRLEILMGDVVAGRALQEFALYTLTTRIDDDQDSLAEEEDQGHREARQKYDQQFVSLRDQFLNES